MSRLYKYFVPDVVVDDTNFIPDASKCNLTRYVDKITGAVSNSASPTDIWFLEMVNGKKGVLKIFVNDNLYNRLNLRFFRGTKQRQPITGLKYEMEIYKLINSNIINSGMCVNFVKMYTGTNECSFEKLANLLHEKGETGWFLNQTAESKLANNILTMTKLLGNVKRQSITGTLSQLAVSSRIKDTLMEDIKSYILSDIYSRSDTLSYILTENTGKQNVAEWFNYINSEYEVWSVIFQIIVACSSLSMFGITHNDLHIGNILIETLPAPLKVSYIIEDEYFTFYTMYKIRIFDYDLSYSNDLGKNEYLDSIATTRNQFISNYDICKVLSYFTRSSYLKHVINLWSNRFPRESDEMKAAFLIACGKTRIGSNTLNRVWFNNPNLKDNYNNKPLSKDFFDNEINQPLDIAKNIGSILAAPTNDSPGEIWGIINFNKLDTNGLVVKPTIIKPYQQHIVRIKDLYSGLNGVINVYKQLSDDAIINEVELSRLSTFQSLPTTTTSSPPPIYVYSDKTSSPDVLSSIKSEIKSKPYS